MLYPHWLNPGDNAWQMTAATLVGLMSVPGLVVLYGGVMQKRWSVNSMMLAFVAFAVILVEWVLFGFKMGFGAPWRGLSHSGFLGNFVGKPGAVLDHNSLQGRGNIPLVGKTDFPQSSSPSDSACATSTCQVARPLRVFSLTSSRPPS